jgi:hypothetical protein
VVERVPILIGITGKRDLKGQDETVRQRLGLAFDEIDRQTPRAPKVLLSGMAIGADTIAAELATKRPDWLVAAVLPFDKGTYLEDFSGDQRAVLEAWLAHPKVKTCPLPLLDNPYTGKPCTRAELRNSPNTTNPLRVLHYEQLGLWLARAATLLIAVLPADEQPDQPGGTARVVQYRLSGRPDATARLVMSASEVVCRSLELDTAALGPAWLIDAPTDRPAGSHPFTACLDERDKQTLDDSDERIVDGKWRSERQRRSLTVARGLNGLAARGGAAEPPVWQQDGTDPIVAIGAIHAAIDHIQGHHKRRLVYSSYTLAVLFWFAVGTYGLIEMIRRDYKPIGTAALVAYLLMVTGAVLVHAVVDRRRWQRITEDYRGVIEALRMQRAWWHAGLAGPWDQVDRYFLNAAPLPFVYVRQAVRNIVYWVRLNAAPMPIQRDWREVYDRHNPDSWIMGQISYFRRRGEERKRQVARTQMLSWEAFFAAQFMAVWLLLETIPPPWLPHRLDRLLNASTGWVLPAACLATAAVAWLFRHLRTRTTPPPRRWSAAFAVVLALLLGAGLHYFSNLLSASEVGNITVPLAVVVLSAAAVGIRFVAEKLVWEAEAHRYEAALALFERAAGELDVILGDETPAYVPEEALDVVRALGRAALEENEYWMRTHRERPVEQAVG